MEKALADQTDSGVAVQRSGLQFTGLFYHGHRLGQVVGQLLEHGPIATPEQSGKFVKLEG